MRRLGLWQSTKPKSQITRKDQNKQGWLPAKKIPAAVSAQIEEEAESISNYIQSVLQDCEVPVNVSAKKSTGT